MKSFLFLLFFCMPITIFANPLHDIAAHYYYTDENLKQAEMLLKAGINPLEKNENGLTPLEVILQQNHAISYSRNHFVGMVTLLVRYGGYNGTLFNGRKLIPLLTHSEDFTPPTEFLEALFQAVPDADLLGINGVGNEMTPVMDSVGLVAFYGYQNFFWLADHGANVLKSTDRGFTALMGVAMCGGKDSYEALMLKAVDYLIKQGADVNQIYVYYEGHSVLDYADRVTMDTGYCSYNRFRSDRLIELLKKAGARHYNPFEY